jgi:hypothetical protein
MTSASPVRKLALFAAVIAVVFAAAAVAGSAVGPDRSGDDGATGMSTESEGEEHGMSTETEAADPVRGLAVADDGLTLALERTQLERARPAELRFAILASGGQAVQDFDVEHERRMHVIVVKRDGSRFQHLHPELGADGTWSVPVTLAEAGSYRVFADFKHDGEAETLAADLTVDGAADYRPLPEPKATAEAGDGYEVRLDTQGVAAGREAELLFTVTRDGKAVTTEPYLGAGGHLVALREGDLAFLHVHPEEGGDGDAVAFMSEFPSAGRYRLYLQFKHEGRVRTAAFTQEVSR